MNKELIVRYIKEALQLSGLRANVTAAGITKQSLVRYTGREAVLDINLDGFISACSMTMPNDYTDGTSTPYADEATAIAALADQVISCLIETTPASPLANLTASFSSNTLSVSDSFTGGGGNRAIQFSAYLSAGLLNLELTYSIAVDNGAPVQANLDLLDSSGNILDGVSSTSLSGTIRLTVPTSGCYRVGASFSNTPGPSPTYLDLTASITNPSMQVGTISALWDDGVDDGSVECA